MESFLEKLWLLSFMMTRLGSSNALRRIFKRNAVLCLILQILCLIPLKPLTSHTPIILIYCYFAILKYVYF